MKNVREGAGHNKTQSVCISQNQLEGFTDANAASFTVLRNLHSSGLKQRPKYKNIPDYSKMNLLKKDKKRKMTKQIDFSKLDDNVQSLSAPGG